MLDIDVALTIKRMCVSFVPLMFGIILHEIAHGWMAARCGDPTAKNLGRLTLNPIPHIDTAGLLFFVMTSLLSPVTLGWAKPVPITPQRFRNLTRDLVAVSAAGPVTNFLVALAAAGSLKLYLTIFPFEMWSHSGVWEFFFLMLYSGVSINCALGWFNLIPVPPLDGSKLLWAALPPKAAWHYMQLERYGMMLILLLLMIGAFQYILGPLISFSIQLMLGIFGLS